jgi:hypothetical protein
MTRTSTRLNIRIAIVLLVLVIPLSAKADGGIIRLRETRGPFSVTIFLSSDATESRAADLSVLIQERDTARVILDANVIFSLSPPPDGVATKQSDGICGLPQSAMHLGDQTSIRASREQASNKLLYAAPVIFNAPGAWKLHVLVSRGTATAQFDCLLPVTSNSGGLTRVWPYLLLPPLAIFAFAGNQRLRHSLQKPESQTTRHPANE